MRVLVHAVGAVMGGAVRHLASFLPALGNERRHEYVILIRDSLSGDLRAPNISFVPVPGSKLRTEGQRLVFDLFHVPTIAKERACGVIVSLTNFGPIWSSLPHVLFQRNSLYFCDRYLRTLPLKQKINVSLRRAWLRASMTRAHFIVTPSRAMASMIREKCPGIEPGKFRVLYHGYDLPTSPQGCHSSPQTPPVLFYPSHLGGYKGFRVLFFALAKLKMNFPNIRLVLTIGEEDDPALLAEYRTIIHQLHLTENVEMIGRIGHAEVCQQLAHASVMVFPSMCESFGFPLLEALGAGTPIVASDIDVNHEVAGNAALFFEPESADDAASKIKEAISNEKVKSKLRENGKTRLTEFDWSWRRNVHEFANILDEVKDAAH